MSLPLAALAQSETPTDLVYAVNDLRAQHGLEPYRIDPWLMAYAQEHAEYQATIQTGTHIHSDGTRPQDIGLQENVAGGTVGFMTVAEVVYVGWVSDWGHRHTMLGYSTGEIGAGIALSENGLIYYALDIRPGEEVDATTPQPGAPDPFVPLETSTPGENSSIIHTVSAGETLWGIAQSYGVTVDDIRRLNGMAADDTFIYVGQKLLIKLTTPATTALPDEISSPPAQTLEETTAFITETIAPSKTAFPSPSFTALPSLTNTVTPTSNPTKLSPEVISIVPVIIVAIAIIGLLLTAIVGLRNLNNNI